MSTVATRKADQSMKPALRLTRAARKGHRAHVAYRQAETDWAPSKSNLSDISKAFQTAYKESEEFTEDFFSEV